MTPADARIDVRKTYKLYVGGAFPRSESGRSYVVERRKGRFLANASYASRKDARDAVGAARKAFGGWSARTPYNRGQVVYRVAEVLEGRRAQFVDEVQRAEGVTKRQAEAAVDEAVDRLVWYAGWADKVAQVVGGTNPVAAPYFNFSRARAHRRRGRARAAAVVAARPGQRGRAGDRHRQHRAWSLVGHAAAAGDHLSEVLATSDVPGGVVNVLTGALGRDRARGWPRTWTSTRIDLTGVAGDADVRCATSRRPRPRTSSACARARRRARLDAGAGLDRMTAVPGDQDGLAPDRHLRRPVHATRSIVLAGPSGSGKSRLCRRLGLPTVNLDDFYKDGDDPTLPRDSPAVGIVDWDDPGRGCATEAVDALEQLCRDGAARGAGLRDRAGRAHRHRKVELGDAPYFVAEGIFAQEVVAPCRERGRPRRRRSACATTRW